MCLEVGEDYVFSSNEVRYIMVNIMYVEFILEMNRCNVLFEMI